MAATYLSSRAFPSSLLSATPTIAAKETSYPVLLPAVDSLNHRRAEKISWVVTTAHSNDNTLPTDELQITLQSGKIVEAGEEVLNNYGLKSNAELILGYGFSLPDNPEDVLVLKLGGDATSGRRFELGRSLHELDGVFQEFRRAFIAQVSSADPDAVLEDWEIEMEVTDRLKEMLATMADRLHVTQNKLEAYEKEQKGTARPEVIEMIRNYIRGR